MPQQQAYRNNNIQQPQQQNVGYCGLGYRNGGLCVNPAECCSQYGHCGTTAEHCAYDDANANSLHPPSTGGVAPSLHGTCGGGQTGNGICSNNAECCSEFGFCGTSQGHCEGKVGNLGPDYSGNAGARPPASTPQFNPQGILVPGAAPAPQQQQAAAPPQVYGSCGGGQTGNGICSNNAECCSKYGFCGTLLEHCTNRIGPAFPGQPQYAGEQVPQPNGPSRGQQSPLSQQRPLSGNGPGNGPGNGQYDGGAGAAASSSAYTSAVGPHGTNKKIIGYYAGWQWYDRDKLARPENMDFRKLQRVNFAFFQPDPAGNVFGTDRWGDPQLLFGPYSSKAGGGVQRCSYDGPGEVNCAYHEMNAGIIHQAHGQGAEVYPSIGGWTLSEHFPTLSADPFARDAFAKNCADILTYHDFDGIDIDWEYPGYADHGGRPTDKENFTKMLAAVKFALEMLTRTTGKEYGLTAALPCSPSNIANIEVGKIATILTEFNLMSYDFHGSWDDVTGVNAPLYYQGYGDEEFNIHRCVENYVALGVPRERINIGLPFYGRSFKDARALNQKHRGNDLANWGEDDGTPQFFNIHKKLPHMTQMRDNKSKTQYAYISRAEQQQQATTQVYGRPHSDVGDIAQSLPEGLVSFDDERAICDKVHYSQEKKLGGFIIWELSGDLLADLSTPLLDITNKKLGNPSLECCMLHSTEECARERAEDARNRNAEASSQMGGFSVGRWTGGSQANDSQRRRNQTLTHLVVAALVFLSVFW